MKKLRAIILLIITLTLVACGDSTAEEPADGDDEVKELRVGIVVGDWSNQYAGLDEWKETIEEKSNGNIEFIIFPDGQLGGERELLEAVQNNTLDIAIVSSFVYANFVPETAVIDIPYMVSDYEEAEKLFDGPFGERISEIMTDNGLRNLAWGHNDFRTLANSKHPIEEPADLSGLKMRVPESSITSAWYESMGASPTTMPFTDVYTALQQGVVDGQESGPFMVYSTNFYDYQPYMTVSNHQYSPVGYFVSDNAWEKLTEEEQELLKMTALEAAEINREFTRRTTQEALDAMEEEGVEITILSENTLNQFRDTNEGIIEEARAIAGDEFTDLILDESSKISN